MAMMVDQDDTIMDEENPGTDPTTNSTPLETNNIQASVTQTQQTQNETSDNYERNPHTTNDDDNNGNALDSSSKTSMDEISNAREASQRLNQSLLAKDRENSFIAMKSKNDALEKTNLDQQTQITTLLNTIEQLKERVSETDVAISTSEALKRKNADLVEKEKDAEERVARTMVENDALRQELSRITNSNTSLQTQLTELQTSTEINSSSTLPLKYEATRLRADLDALTQHSNWLETELKSRTEQLSKVKLDFSKTTSELYKSLETIQSDRDKAQLEFTSLQRKHQSTASQLEVLHKEYLELSQNNVEVIHEKELEIQAERRMTALQKENLAITRDQYDDVVREMESLKSLSRAMKEDYEREIEDLKTRMEEEVRAALNEAEECHQQVVKELESQIEKVTVEKLRLEDDFMSGKGDTVNQRGGGTLLLRDEVMRDQGEVLKLQYASAADGEIIGLTELYEKLAEAQDIAQKERTERKRVELYIERIHRDVEKSTSKFQHQRKEYQLAISQRTEIQNRYDELSSEVDFIQSKFDQVQRENNKLDLENQELRHENEDLAIQVQQLLRKSLGVDSNQTDGEGLVDMVGFGSVEELQDQNQRLLREHHRLNKIITDLEERLDTETVQIQLRESESALQELREERDQQRVLVKSIVQERDLYRALLCKNDVQILADMNNDELSSNSLIAAKNQIEKYTEVESKNRDLLNQVTQLKAEIATSENTIVGLTERLKRSDVMSSDLTSSVNSLQNDLSAAYAQIARCEAEAKFQSQRATRVEDDLNSSKNELSRSKEREKDLKNLLDETEAALSKANHDVNKYHDAARQAEVKLRHAEGKISTMQAMEARLNAENNALSAEIAKHGALHESMQKIELSLSTRAAEERDRLDQEISRLKDTIASERSKYSLDLEKMQLKLSEDNDRVASLESNKDELVSELMKSKDVAMQSQNEFRQLTDKCTDLEKQLNAAKIRLGDDDVDMSEQEKVADLVNQVETLKTEVEEANKKVENYKNIAKSSQKALIDLTKANDEFKARKDEQLNDLRNELDKAIQTATLKQEALDEISLNLNSNREEQDKVIEELRTNNMKLAKDLEASQQDADKLKSQLTNLSDDLNIFKADVRAATDNYERELALHASAREALRKTRADLEAEIRVRHIAETERDEMRSDFSNEKSSWEQVRSALQTSENEATKRLEDTLKQNEILHNQLASLSKSVEEFQSGKISSVLDDADESNADTNDSSVQKQISELREMVRYMRSEREIFETQLQSSRRSLEREKATVEIMKRSLDEARAELSLLQQQHAGEEEKTDESTADKLVDTEGRLKHTEEQLVLLRESNQLLREETEKLRNTVKKFESECEEVKRAIKPLEDKCRDLEIDKSVLNSEKESLHREMDSWKGRVQSLVSKFHQIDPEEHAKLQTDLDGVKKECETLKASKEQADKETASAKSIAVRQNKEMQKMKTQLSSTKAELEKITAEKTSLQSSQDKNIADLKTELEELKKSRDELQSKQDMSEQLQSRITRLTNMLTKNKEKFKEVQQKEQEFRTLHKQEQAARQQLEIELQRVKSMSKEKDEEMTNIETNESSQKDSVDRSRSESTSEPTSKITDSSVAEVSMKQNTANTQDTSLSQQVDAKQGKENDTPTATSENLPKPIAENLPEIPKEGFKFGPSKDNEQAVKTATADNIDLVQPTSTAKNNTTDVGALKEQLSKKQKQLDEAKRKAAAVTQAKIASASAVSSEATKSNTDTAILHVSTIASTNEVDEKNTNHESVETGSSEVPTGEPTNTSDNSLEPESSHKESQVDQPSSGPFLNLQPPGSNQPSALVFGSSPNIQLPVPAKKQVEKSPFSAFEPSSEDNAATASISIDVPTPQASHPNKKRSLEKVENEAESSTKLARIDEESDESGEVKDDTEEPASNKDVALESV